MTRRLCLLTGIYPPDVGGPANFAETFCHFRSVRSLPTTVITYTDSRDFRNIDEYVTVLATSRRHKILPRYVRTIILLRNEIRKNSKILANGCFIEIALLGLIKKFTYTVKIPGDIVWERAKNKGVTNLGIDEFQFQKLPTRYRIFKLLFRRSICQAKVVIVPSSHLGALALTWGVKPENLRVIHNSVDLDHFNVEKDSSKEYDFVTLCRLVKWKRVDEVIDAVSRSASSLLVIGDGPERKALEKLASNHPIKIQFVGNLQKSEIPAALSSARYFVLNSDFEATSYALMEAMALGLVPISREDTGSAEVIGHLEDGILCGAKTNYDLNFAVQALVEGRLNSDNLATKAREKIEKNFNSRINYQEIIDCCE